jgi:hypothetical protein
MNEYIPEYSARAQLPKAQESDVALHVLCDHCRAMKLEDRSTNDWKYEVRDSAADFITRSRTCHLCMMLLSQLHPERTTETSQNFQHTGIIYFESHPELRRWRYLSSDKIIFKVSTEIFVGTGSSATLLLIPYSRKSPSATTSNLILNTK